MFNQKIYNELLRGLKQQLWFFGQDTSDRENNLFEQYGFYRYRTPGHGGSNRYKIRWGIRTLELHSFCVGIYGNNQDGFIFIRAYEQAYLYLGKKPPVPGRYRETYLAFPSAGEDKKGFYETSSEFLEWLEHYESWIDDTYGKEYRLDCYEKYHRKWLEPDKARKWFKDYRELAVNKKLFKAV